MYKILLVEDETVIRQGLREIIIQSGDHFMIAGEAGDGTSALEFLRCEIPDVIITDIRMREMDGLTLVAKAKEMYPDLPVVIISGYGEFEYAKEAIRIGVCDYLLKPIRRTELAASLDKIKRSLDAKYGIQHAQDLDQEEWIAQNTDTRKIIRDVKEYVKRHIDGDLRLQTVADVVNLNASYLSQLFKNETGTNYSEYVAAAQIEKAKWLLAETPQLKIYDVARFIRTSKSQAFHARIQTAGRPSHSPVNTAMNTRFTINKENIPFLETA